MKPWRARHLNSVSADPKNCSTAAERVGRAHEIDAVCRRATLRRAKELLNGVLLFLNMTPDSLEHGRLDPRQFRRRRPRRRTVWRLHKRGLVARDAPRPAVVTDAHAAHGADADSVVAVRYERLEELMPGQRSPWGISARSIALVEVGDDQMVRMAQTDEMRQTSKPVLPSTELGRAEFEPDETAARMRRCTRRFLSRNVKADARCESAELGTRGEIT